MEKTRLCPGPYRQDHLHPKSGFHAPVWKPLFAWCGRKNGCALRLDRILQGCYTFLKRQRRKGGNAKNTKGGNFYA